ncbi:MAG: hypothetical protein NTW03_03045 [Verrucomicrobia bacterium]|nr:hypothetical protein [Verrucomicrobiota bacterium]
MKTTTFLALALMFTGLVCRGQDDSGEDISGPGWVQALSWADPLTPASTEEKAANSVTFPAGKPIAEAVTPQIQALARGLGNDPVRIFNYVHDNIHHVFYFGSKKGAQLTLLEKSGNDFDQSALLVALLRAANYTNVGYQFAILKMPYDSADTNDLHHWLGLSLCNTNWPNTSNYFKWLPSSRGYPVWVSGWATNGILDTNTIGLPRVWVTLTLTNGGTTYVLDPAFKITQPVAGIDLAAATGLASGAFITSNALITAAGGTATGEFVKSLSESGLRNNLRSATTNLLGYIQKNTTNPTADQVLGGQQIGRTRTPWRPGPISRRTSCPRFQ